MGVPPPNPPGPGFAVDPIETHSLKPTSQGSGCRACNGPSDESTSLSLLSTAGIRSGQPRQARSKLRFAKTRGQYRSSVRIRVKTPNLLLFHFIGLLVVSSSRVGAAPGANQDAIKPKFRVLALAEPGGHHLAFSEAAKPWLQKRAEENRFTIDFINSVAPVTAAFLNNYQVILQLDFVPYGWSSEAMTAFKSYIEEGKGGWVGLHHATLLGEFDKQPMWPWFSDFMGKIRFKNYIPTFAAGTVHVEDRSHPCMKDVPGSFVIAKEEWYTWDRSPRPNVRVLATVDETSYDPPSNNKMGDHPVIWTNERVRARNVYLFMGHGPDLLENKAFTTILSNAIVWAAGQETSREPIP